MKTVVVTGIGASTPLAGTAPETWQRMLDGVSGIRALTEGWAQDLPVQIAAKAAVDPSETLDRVAARKMDRSTQLVMVAALEAWHDAGLKLDAENQVDPERLGVCVATGIGGLHTLLGQWDVFRDRGHRRVSPLTIPMLMANAPAANVGLRFGARAGIHTPVSACASSNEAISLALDMLRLGRADVVAAGGGEAVVHPLPLTAFAKMQALSRRNEDPEAASRPWDANRDGFVLGEGSAMLILETLEHAQARGAKIYATLAGAGMSADSHDMVQPEPSGRGQAAAMRKALTNAGLKPTDIAHINAHATATPTGDTIEAASIFEVLGAHTPNVVVTGTKSMTGHLLGGAGALESLATIQAIGQRVSPPTINLDDVEDGVELNIAANVPAKLPAGDLAAINNSFGFGGHNVAVLFTTENRTR